MAVTVTASKVDITSGTETIDSVYTAVAASPFPGVMSKTGTDPGPYTYTFNGNILLEVSSGSTLNCSNPDDTIQWALTGTMNPSLQVISGGTWTAAEGVTFDGDSNGANNYSRIYNYGYSSIQGKSDGTNDVVFKNYYEIRFYAYEGNSPHNWNHVTTEWNNSVSSNGTGLYFANDPSIKPTHTLQNISITSTSNRSYAATFYCHDWSGCTFDNWTVDGTRYLFNTYGTTVKFSNSTFKNVYYYSLIRSQSGGGLYKSTTDSSDMYDTAQFQPKITFDTCTFQNNRNSSATEMGFYISYGAIIKFKDCTFAGTDAIDPMSYGVYSRYNSRMLYEGTTTFTDVTTNRIWSTNGSHYHVWPLALTVNDPNGNAIQDAEVIVYQVSGNEHWFFKTDASGNIYDVHGDDPVFVEKEETSTGVYSQWSDSIASGRYHTIIVAQEGYQVWQRRVTFTSAQTITATLIPTTAPRTLPVTYKG